MTVIYNPLPVSLTEIGLIAKAWTQVTGKTVNPSDVIACYYGDAGNFLAFVRALRGQEPGRN